MRFLRFGVSRDWDISDTRSVAREFEKGADVHRA